MRVIAGRAKGIFLKTLVNKELRPTSQKVKEALFNILGNSITGKRFLDLFAGVGTIGIEALSRGASSAVFVERDRKAAQLLRENLKMTGFVDCGIVIQGDVKKSIVKLQMGPFGFIFLDPPYNFLSCQEVLRCIMEKCILEESGIIIVEHYHKTPPVIPGREFVYVRQEKYGQTVLSFIKPARSGVDFPEPGD